MIKLMLEEFRIKLSSWRFLSKTNFVLRCWWRCSKRCRRRSATSMALKTTSWSSQRGKRMAAKACIMVRMRLRIEIIISMLIWWGCVRRVNTKVWIIVSICLLIRPGHMGHISLNILFRKIFHMGILMVMVNSRANLKYIAKIKSNRLSKCRKTVILINKGNYAWLLTQSP